MISFTALLLLGTAAPHPIETAAAHEPPPAPATAHAAPVAEEEAPHAEPHVPPAEDHAPAPEPAEEPAQADPGHAAEPVAAPRGKPSKTEQAEIHQSLLRIGDAKITQGDTGAAIIAFRQVAESRPAPDTALAALMGLARAYTKAGETVKAIATYEHLLKNFDAGSTAPVANLEAGRLLREVGSGNLALARFYSVIHTSLKLTSAELENYREVVRTAQLEIAETHLQMGNYDEATRFFKRFNLLEVSDTDRAWARFRIARAQILGGQQLAATATLRAFITSYPDNEHTPEAHFLLATLLDELNQPEKALEVTVALLQRESQYSDTDRGRWRRWQQRTGNQLANTYYTRGDFRSALILYQSLLALDHAPDWAIPLLYQQGLCFERLRQPDRAAESYGALIALGQKNVPADLGDMVRMAEWRTKQIKWWQETEQAMHLLDPAVDPTVLPPT